MVEALTGGRLCHLLLFLPVRLTYFVCIESYHRGLRPDPWFWSRAAREEGGWRLVADHRLLWHLDWKPGLGSQTPPAALSIVVFSSGRGRGSGWSHVSSLLRKYGVGPSGSVPLGIWATGTLETAECSGHGGLGHFEARAG